MLSYVLWRYVPQYEKFRTFKTPSSWQNDTIEWCFLMGLHNIFLYACCCHYPRPLLVVNPGLYSILQCHRQLWCMGPWLILSVHPSISLSNGIVVGFCSACSATWIVLILVVHPVGYLWGLIPVWPTSLWVCSLYRDLWQVISHHLVGRVWKPLPSRAADLHSLFFNIILCGD